MLHSEQSHNHQVFRSVQNCASVFNCVQNNTWHVLPLLVRQWVTALSKQWTTMALRSPALRNTNINTIPNQYKYKLQNKWKSARKYVTVFSQQQSHWAYYPSSKVYVLFHGGIVLISLNRPGYSSNIIRVLDHCSTKNQLTQFCSVLRMLNSPLVGRDTMANCPLNTRLCSEPSASNNLNVDAWQRYERVMLIMVVLMETMVVLILVFHHFQKPT